MGLSYSHPDSHPASVRLVAWPVAKQANGDIDVAINQLKDWTTARRAYGPAPAPCYRDREAFTVRRDCQVFGITKNSARRARRGPSTGHQTTFGGSGTP